MTVAGPMVPAPHRVVDRRVELADTVTLSLEPVDGRPVEPASAGQFAMLYAWGIGEVPISMSSSPSEPGPVRHTIRAVGAVTSALCAAQPGDVIGSRGPFGRGWGVDRGRGHDVVVVAGGIGLAPLRPVVDQVLADRDAFGRVAVLVGARTPDTLLFRRELEGWRSRLDVDVLVTVDRATTEWHGDVGMVTALVDRLPVDPADAWAFLCGPEVMMRFTAGELLRRGVPRDRLEVSLERNMRCAVAQCGHCQIGPTFVCREGPVYSWTHASDLLEVRER